MNIGGGNRIECKKEKWKVKKEKRKGKTEEIEYSQC